MPEPQDLDALAAKHGGAVEGGDDLDALAAKHGGVPVVASGSFEEPPGTLTGQAKQFGKNLGLGAAKSLGETMATMGTLGTLTGIGAGLPPISSPSYERHGIGQKLGAAAEQTGEIMLPGGGERKLAAMLPERAQILARPALQGLSMGAINKMHGGDFASGAKAGALAGGFGEIGSAVAPGLAEGALGIRGMQKMHGATPGEAILSETTGVRPGTIATQAKDKVSKLYDELLSKASQRDAELTVPPPTTNRGLLGAAPQTIPLGKPPSPIDVPGQLLPAREMRRANITGGTSPETVSELGAPTAGVVPSRLQRQGFLTSSPESWEQGAEGARAVEKNPVPRGPSGPGVMETRDPELINRFRQTTPGPYRIPTQYRADAPTVQPAIGIVDDAIKQARAQNSPYVDLLQQVRSQLTHDRITGEALPLTTTPTDILQRKQGIGHLIGNWERQNVPLPQHVKEGVYGALDAELDRTVPGAQELNQRMSSLIPASRRAEITEQAPGIAQRVTNRIARPTGGLALPMLGAAEGYREHGGLGAAVGGMAGLVGLEALNSPTGQMAAARLLRSGVPTRAIPAMTMELLRQEEKDQQ